jgi:hypothetical protein
MQKIIYLCPKERIHGFLKFEDEKSPGYEPNVYSGPEIHFSVPPTAARWLYNRLCKAFNIEPKKPRTENRPLVFQAKKGQLREAFKYQSVVVTSGDDLKTLWAKLTDIAQQISNEGHMKNHTQTNCHTLLFDLLDRAELNAPRDYYMDNIYPRLPQPNNVTPVTPICAT